MSISVPQFSNLLSKKIHLLHSVLGYQKNKGYDVYSWLLDCSKAFDKANIQISLIDCSNEKYLHLSIIIMNMYINGSMLIRWGDATSEYFRVCNGIRQGSVLSPICFSICIDDLIEILRKNKEGCWMGNTFFGCIVYADNVPCLRSIQSMLNICNDFAD